MSKTWKWIIGILVGLVLVCGVVSIGFMVFGRINGSSWGLGVHAPRVWEGERLFPRNDRPWDDMPMHPNRLFPGRMMRGFFPFGGFFGGLFCLGFGLLILLGIVALVLPLTRSRKPAAAGASQAPPAPLAEGAEMATPAHPCPNCQRPLNDDWSHCPYCGTALTPPD